MLENTITLSIDSANNGTPADVVYTRFDEFQNRTVYNGPSHSLTEKDTINFYRTFPKKSGNSNGVGRAAIKITEDVEVQGVDVTTTLVAPLIADVAFATPVGTPTAKCIEIRQRLIALLDNDVLMLRLQEKLEV